MAKDPKKAPKPAPVPKPRPKPRPPIQSQPGDILRDRRRLSAPMKFEQGLGLKESDMNYNRKKGLGMAVSAASGSRTNPGSSRPGNEGRMPYRPGTGETKTMPYTPGTGSTQTMPYRPKPKMKPMSYDNEPMDMGWESDTPPGYATMGYNPVRDGSASDPIPNYEGDDVGAENMGKQEDNQDWKYDNWRSEDRRPIPEDRAHIYNDIADEAIRTAPDGREDQAAFDEWEQRIRQRGAQAGLSGQEIEDLIDDMYNVMREEF